MEPPKPPVDKRQKASATDTDLIRKIVARCTKLKSIKALRRVD
jgi:hypothetical protein